MKVEILVLVFCILQISCQKSKDYDDESRPYEFGFTIDGQQHRHESKDINGIIMGEFGFITADGVYHVTVYATDENGLFKIISMKNVKISEPLDTPGYKFPTNVAQNLNKPAPLREEPPPVTTTPTTTAIFTTLPSLDVRSCGSCKLPKLPPKTPVDNKLQFQTPTFQNTPPNVPPKSQFQQNPDINNPSQFNTELTDYSPPFTQNQKQTNQFSPPNVKDVEFIKPTIDSLLPPLTDSEINDPFKSPKVTVSNNQINIPGREPIQIMDRYTNMTDGLPDGITETDMLELLYKFNYTLGFHGHYEKGLRDGTKIGGYFVNGRDGISRVVEYIADENGYRPKFKFINLGIDSDLTPKAGTEKKFGLKGFEFVWYPV